MSKRSKSQQQRLPVIDAPKRIKVLAIGPATVGKSCLIKRYCEDRFSEKYKGTIGVDYGVSLCGWGAPKCA